MRLLVVHSGDEVLRDDATIYVGDPLSLLEKPREVAPICTHPPGFILVMYEFFFFCAIYRTGYFVIFQHNAACVFSAEWRGGAVL